MHAPQMQPYTTVFIMHQPSYWICEYWKACSKDATIYNSVHNVPSIQQTGDASIGKHATKMESHTTLILPHLSHWICEYWKACSTGATIHNSAQNATSMTQGM